MRRGFVAYVGLTALIACLTVASCSLDESGGDVVAPLDASFDVNDANASDAVAEETADGPTIMPCFGGKPGPTLVVASTSTGDYCIDATEVTQAQYNAFLNTPGGIGVVLEGQVPFCRTKNKQLAPQANAGCAFTPLDSVRRDLPVTCIDYCDALAYCQWAGKHLCGPREDAKQNDCNTGTNLNESEWYLACSHDGTRAYPYGPTFSAGACNDSTRSSGPSTSVPSCQGGYDGLFDMSGNVWEWENDCDSCTEPDASAIQCRVRGGSYQATDDLSCLGTDQLNRRPVLSGLPNVGFRCCDAAIRP